MKSSMRLLIVLIFSTIVTLTFGQKSIGQQVLQTKKFLSKIKGSLMGETGKKTQKSNMQLITMGLMHFLHLMD